MSIHVKRKHKEPHKGTVLKLRVSERRGYLIGFFMPETETVAEARELADMYLNKHCS